MLLTGYSMGASFQNFGLPCARGISSLQFPQLSVMSQKKNISPAGEAEETSSCKAQYAMIMPPFSA